jgi:hypothetical protein
VHDHGIDSGRTNYITSPTNFTFLYIKNQTKITYLPTGIDYYFKH